jgi:hypothetical protein
MIVASHCSFLSAKCQRFENEVNITTQTTGGTNALPNIIGRWRQNIDEWKAIGDID